MLILGRTFARYFGLRALNTILMVFAGIFVLVAILDYIELMRRASDIPNVSALLVAKTSFYRVLQVSEEFFPFCVLIGTMSCYLNFSRQQELVVARAAGVSAWQFISPALVIAFVLGILATAIYNPIAAILAERSKRYEAELFNQHPNSLLTRGRSLWVSQRTAEGEAIINANSSREQGTALGGVTVLIFDPANHFKQRIEARTAILMPGVWRLLGARVYALGARPSDYDEYRLRTGLTPEQVRESFATPKTVPFWKLPLYINIAENAGLRAAGYRLQFQKLLARPFLFAAAVLLAAAVSLRFFRLGGIQKMILSGVAAGVLLYVLSKVTDDMSKAELMSPVIGAWLPVLASGLTGATALLYQEDG